jgi:DNA-binding transcriptional LysR family regulator
LPAGFPLAPWPFLENGRSFTVKVAGDRASDGDIIRKWALDGRGVVLKNYWDDYQDLAAGRLPSVLDDYVVGPVDLYLVQPGRPPSRA